MGRWRAFGFFMGILLVALACRLEAQEFEYGKRPLDGTFDPTGFLAAEEHREIAASISLALAEKNHEVLLVVLDDLAGAPPEFVAERFAAEWKTEELGAVVMHVPGRLSSPWIVPFGAKVAALSPEEATLRIRRLRQRTNAVEGEADRLRLGIKLTLEMLAEWSESADNRAAGGGPSAPAVDSHQGMIRVLQIYATVGLVLILLVVGLVARLWFRTSHRRVFPDRKPETRLGAPHCGGSHVLVRIDSRKKSVP